MRITHVIGGIDPSLGGPPIVVTRLSAAHVRLGHEVGIVAYAAPDREEPIRRFLAGLPELERVRVRLVPPPGALDLLIGGNVDEYFPPASAAPGGPGGPGAPGGGADGATTPGLAAPSIYHLHGVWEPLLLAASRLARKRGIPYALTPHGMLDPWSMQQSRWKKKVALAAGYRDMLRHAAFLHALNADEKAGMAPLGLPAPVEVIPNGVFLEEFDPLPPVGQFRAAFPQLSDRPFVLFLSRLHFKKGLDYLADAFARVARSHPDAALVVAGPDGGARAGFEAAVAAAGLRQRVHVVGPLFGAQKVAALVDAACFCLPSRQEGFSMAITEALACGLPVVISDACHFPEVATAGAGKVVSLDAGSIASALSHLLTDAPLRQRMGQAGRDLVRTRYTWPRIAQNMAEAYGRAARL